MCDNQSVTFLKTGASKRLSTMTGTIYMYANPDSFGIFCCVNVKAPGEKYFKRDHSDTPKRFKSCAL